VERRSFLASRDAKRTFGLRLSKISISTLQSVERTTHDDTATANFPDKLPIMCTYCAPPSINPNNVADQHVALVSGEKSNFQYIIRLLNTNVDGKQKVMYALTKIKGVGRRYSNLVCKKADVDLNKRYGTHRLSLQLCHPE
jgi:Ribosomal protein S13/S18